MKQGIHPSYESVVFRDTTTGNTFLTKSTATSERTIVHTDGQTYPVIDVDVSAYSHPYWTGQRRVLDTAGRVEKFERKYGKRKAK